MKEQAKEEAPVKRPRGRPFGSFNQPPKKSVCPAAAPLTLKELAPPAPEPKEEKKPEQEEEGELELVDSIEFKNGKNDLTIRFSKRHNRMFRVQVFLNGKTEIRPSTYAGNSPGMAFWSLLKDSLR